MSSKVSIIIPYFGKIPPSYVAFLNSMHESIPLEFHLFSDQEFPVDPFGKIRLYRSTLDEMRRAFSRSLEFEVSLDHPYKMCDFRPLYGKLFPSIVGNSDYWGWGDLDVVIGRIGDWVQPLISESVDVISFKKFWLSGSLAILKNRNELIDAYKRLPFWQTVVASASYAGFDECSRRWAEHIAAGDLAGVGLEPLCYSRLLWNDGQLGRLTVSMNDWAKEWIGPSETIAFSGSDHRVYSLVKGEEFPYYHSVCENGLPQFQWPSWDKHLDRFFITREGYWQRQEQITPVNRGLRKARGFAVRCCSAVRRRWPK